MLNFLNMNARTSFVSILLCFVLNISSFALLPSREYRHTPTGLKMKHEEKRVQTPDGTSILMWYFPSPRISNKLIIVSHNGVGNMGDNLARIRGLIALGFNVLCYDYRGYGASSDFSISDEIYLYAGFYEDFEAVYNYAVENYGRKIYLYGWGIGATVSITIGYTKVNTFTIVADGPVSKFSDMPERFSKIGSRMIIDPEVLASYPDPSTVLGGTPPINFRGILLIVGSHDHLFTPSDMEGLKAQIDHNNVQVHVVNNKRSIDNYNLDPIMYSRKIGSFFVNY